MCVTTVYGMQSLNSAYEFQATTCARPLVGVHVDRQVSGVSVALPAVFRAPIRPDVVNFVHDQMAKNTRQSYCVNKDAGECCLPYYLVVYLTFGTKKDLLQMYQIPVVS